MGYWGGCPYFCRIFFCLTSSDIIHVNHITDFVQSHMNVYIYLGETHAMTCVFIFHGILSWINWETRSYEISSDKMLKTIACGSLFYQNVGNLVGVVGVMIFYITLIYLQWIFLLILILPLCKLYCLWFFVELVWIVSLLPFSIVPVQLLYQFILDRPSTFDFCLWWYFIMVVIFRWIIFFCFD